MEKEMINKLKKEWQENQKAITGKRKVSKEERLELIKRNQEIWNILGKVKGE